MEFNPVLLNSDNRKIKIITLDNNINILYIKDNVKMSLCSVCVGNGYLSDEFDGTAHFLEHLLFMGSTKFPDRKEYHSYILQNNGEDNAFTSDHITFYYFLLDNEYFEKGVEMLSWFFREPVLDERYIKSESEIIDAEHRKNILQDQWIMDDLLKKFMNNKYNKFGTGCLESLEGIRREDINKFYKDYYTTDNINVCIIDNIDIDEMEKKYNRYFADIPKTIKKQENKEKVNLKEENIITFQSISNYKLLNIYMIVDIDNKDVLDIQIINFLLYIIGCEYDNSIGYYLKKSNIINSFNIRIDYIYDEECVITMSFKNNIEEYEEIYDIIVKYMEYIKNIDGSIIEKLWNNYINIMLLQEINEIRRDLTDIASYYLDNMNKYGKERALDIKYNIEKYNIKILDRMKKIIESIRYKMIKNFGNSNYDKESKYYKTKYNIEKRDIMRNEKIYNFKVENMIGIENFDSIKYNRKIKNNNDNEEDKSEIEKIKEDIYIIKDDRFDIDKSKIVLLRRNNMLLDGKKIMIFSIYNDIMEKLLINYKEVMSMYEMNYNMSIANNNIIYEFSGLDDYLIEYIENILKKIRDNNRLLKNEFENIRKEYIEYYENIKYNMPFEICNKYLGYIYRYENFLPINKIKYLKQLTFNKFKKELRYIFNYDDEQIILYGKTFNNKENIEKLEKYIKNINKKQEINYEYRNNILRKYKLKKSEINENEDNNCVLFNFYVAEITNENEYEEIIKNILIANILSNILKEPLFDNIRTVNKMGYIAKCIVKVFENKDKINILISYIIQSRYDIKKIIKKVELFNKNFIENIDTVNIEEKIKNIIESIINSFKKPDNNINSVISNYINKFISYYLNNKPNFTTININDIKINILQKLNVNDIKILLVNLLNSDYGFVIFDKNNIK